MTSIPGPMSAAFLQREYFVSVGFIKYVIVRNKLHHSISSVTQCLLISFDNSSLG